METLTENNLLREDPVQSGASGAADREDGIRDGEPIRICGPDGEGSMVCHLIFPGILLIRNDLRLSACAAADPQREDILRIDHCREGRMELVQENGSSCCMEQGEVRIAGRCLCADRVRFPLGFYRGLTLRMETETAARALQRELPSFSFDLKNLSRKFGSAQRPYMLHREPSLERIFEDLYRMCGDTPKDCYRVKVLELLLALDLLELQPYHVEKPCFPVAQMEKIHAIHDLITTDLTASYTAQELADRFEIGMTVMKSCFRSTYGQPISTYLRHYRIHRAARLLVDEPRLRTAQIGEMIGYGSASKFTAVFHEIMGVTPLEYRKSHKPEPGI